jgi:hypothetical protein
MAYSATDFQLTHLLQQGFRKLRNTRISTATGGSTTTIVDSKLIDYLGDSNEDDILNGGTVILIKDAGGAGAAPEGEIRYIDDYTSSTGTITFTAMTAAPASGDTYMLVSRDFPLYDMLEVVNDALAYLGQVAPTPDTSLTTVVSQTEYTLPIAMQGAQILDVTYQDSGNDRNIPVDGWKLKPATAGSTGILVIPDIGASRTLEVTYLTTHPKVSVYSDYISKVVYPDVAVRSFVAHAWEWLNHNSGSADDLSRQTEDRAWNQLDIALTKNRLNLPMRRIIGAPHWTTHAPTSR